MAFLPLTLAVVANYFIIKTGPRLRRTTIKVTVTELLFEPPLWRFFYPKKALLNKSDLDVNASRR